MLFFTIIKIYEGGIIMLIPDENLGYVVSRTLRVKPHELTPELMTKITRLEAPNHEIRSL